jgi:hypothetical protein
MRFMMIVKADKDSEAGKLPSEAALAAMAKYNESLVKAGVLLDAVGLQPSSKGARITMRGGKPRVIDGPFAETKELIAGYWMIQVRTKEEAIEWAKRIPFEHIPEVDGPGVVELRQVFELEDFGQSEAVEKHKELGKQFAK